MTASAADGPVLSSFNVSGAALVGSPAAFVQEPLNTCPAVSAVCCSSAVHVVGLLMPSEPSVSTVTSLVYQPLEPSVPAVTASAADGPVLSSFTVSEVAFVGQTRGVRAGAGEHLPRRLAPSAAASAVQRGRVADASPSRSCRRVTSLVYQPLEPSVPAVTASVGRRARGVVLERTASHRTSCCPRCPCTCPRRSDPCPRARCTCPSRMDRLTRPLRSSVPFVVHAGEVVYQPLLPFGSEVERRTADGSGHVDLERCESQRLHAVSVPCEIHERRAVDGNRNPLAAARASCLSASSTVQRSPRCVSVAVKVADDVGLVPAGGIRRAGSDSCRPWAGRLTSIHRCPWAGRIASIGCYNAAPADGEFALFL